jgi:hypothetical protein
MTKILIIEGGSLESYFELILEQVDQVHYNRPTSIVPIELTQEEISQMSVDNALGEYLASLEAAPRLTQPRRLTRNQFEAQRRRHAFI